ncbi:MAG TPA: class I SAM-dependent methyltransferase [Bryobacteraceae bacterium]
MAVYADGWWFDFTRGVKTAGSLGLETLELAGTTQEGFMYHPSGVRAARGAIRAVPVQDYSQFTFVDFGSGKGRVLFLAAEFPFRKITGVEFARELHGVAEANIRRFRERKPRSVEIESTRQNALDFPFPPDRLVLFFFNPFPVAVMRRVLENLRSSLAENPREAFVVLLYPDEHGPLADSLPWLRICEGGSRRRIYEGVLPTARPAQ